MATSVWMLELGRTHWRLHAKRDDDLEDAAFQEFIEQDLVAQTQCIQEALTSHHYGGEPIILALDSRWCFTTTLVVNRPQELRDCQTMLYRLEECIPWAAEDCVADYIGVGN